MKKIFTVVAVALIIGCMAFVFSGCGEDNKNTTTTTAPGTSVTTTTTTTNPGMVTDQSEKGENGALGDIVSDVSEDVSDMVTDMSEGASRMMQ